MSPGREGDVTKKLVQPIAIAVADVFQPTRQSSFRRQFHKTGEAQEDRVDRQFAKVSQSSSTDQDQADYGQRHPERTVIRIELSIREDLSDLLGPADRSQEISDQREAGVCRQSLG